MKVLTAAHELTKQTREEEELWGEVPRRSGEALASSHDGRCEDAQGTVTLSLILAPNAANGNTLNCE